MLNRIKIFPVARRNYCHKIKPQLYVHVFTSISMLQNSLFNTTSLTALEILQLLLHFPWLSWPWLFYMTFQAWKMVLLSGHPVTITQTFAWSVLSSHHLAPNCMSYIVTTQLIAEIIFSSKLPCPIHADRDRQATTHCSSASCMELCT